MIAPLLNLHKSPLPPLKTGNQITVIAVIVKNIADNRLFRYFSANILFNLGFFAIAKNQIHFRHRTITLRCHLGGTTGNNNPRLRMIAPQLADNLPALALCLAGHSAGINHNHIFQLGKLFFQDFGFISVNPAA